MGYDLRFHCSSLVASRRCCRAFLSHFRQQKQQIQTSKRWRSLFEIHRLVQQCFLTGFDLARYGFL